MKPRVWNAARDARLRELVAEGESLTRIAAALAALPGAEITKAKQVTDRMRALNLRFTAAQRGAFIRAAFAGTANITYTAERRAYLREAYPAGEQTDVIMAKLNAMAGPKIASPGAIGVVAGKMGLRRKPAEPKRPRRTLIAAPPPTAPAPLPPSAALADAVTLDRYAQVRAAVCPDRSNAEALSRAHNLPLREVYRLAGERRREGAAA